MLRTWEQTRGGRGQAPQRRECAVFLFLQHVVSETLSQGGNISGCSLTVCFTCLCHLT